MKAYYLCINVFKEKEFPHFFATGVVTFAIVANIYIILSFLEYLLLPYRFNQHEEYYRFFAPMVFICAVIYVSYKKKYLNILKSGNNISESRKKYLRIISIVYLLFLFVSFFLLGALIREYNLNHPY